MEGDLYIAPRFLGKDADIYIVKQVKFPKDIILKVGTPDECQKYLDARKDKRNIQNIR